MKILVTGSEGYIGSPLCKTLANSGYEVEKFDKVLGDDITDIVKLDAASRDVDLIVHMASIVGYPKCDANPKLAEKVNIGGTVNVVSCSKRVIFTSALSNYSGAKEVDEDTVVVPKSLYAGTKLEAEHRVLTVRDRKSVVPSFSNVVLRFGSLCGISDNMRDDLLVNNMCKDAVENGKLSIYQPEFVRPLTHIKDAVGAIMFFMCSSQELHGVYNVVSWNLTKEEIAKVVSEESGCSVEYVRGEDKENRSYVASTRKIRSLGFEFDPDFRGCIREMVGMYRC